MIYELPKLEYSYDALEPHIDARTMEVHYEKHHGAYVTKLNEAMASVECEAPEDVNELITDLSKVPEKVRVGVRNNGGGHANHSLFWKILSPGGGGTPLGEIAEAINEKFGGINSFHEQFAGAGMSCFGSGWVWLCVKADNSLCVCSTPNQDNPLMKGIVECEGKPILGLDVWEHAYYLHYQNRRADYIAAFWHVLDWKRVNENYKAALS